MFPEGFCVVITWNDVLKLEFFLPTNKLLSVFLIVFSSVTGTVRNASWFCGSNPVKWVDRPDLKNCVGSEVYDLRRQVTDVLHCLQCHSAAFCLESHARVRYL